MKLNRCKHCNTTDQTKTWSSKTSCHNCYQKIYVESNILKRICVFCGSTSSKGSWYKGPKCSVCYHNKRYKSEGRGKDISQKYSHLISQSKRRNSICDISKDQYINLIKNGCYYCDRNLMELTGHSLDKIDSDTGYTIKNVLPCCGDCNSIRMNLLTVKETKLVVDLIKSIRKTNSCPWLLCTRADELNDFTGNLK